MESIQPVLTHEIAPFDLSGGLEQAKNNFLLDPLSNNSELGSAWGAGAMSSAVEQPLTLSAQEVGNPSSGFDVYNFPESYGTTLDGKASNLSSETGVLTAGETSDPLLFGDNYIASVVPDPGNTLGAAYDVGTLNGTRTLTDFVGSTDTNDYYRFSLASVSNFNVSLTGLNADADVQLLDSNGNFITYSNRSSNGDESINRALAAGTYFVRVYQYSGDTNYTLNLSTDQRSNLLPTETDIGTLTNTLTFTDFVGSTDTADTYRFSLGGTSNFSLSLTGLSTTYPNDADVRLIQDVNNDGMIQDTEVIASSARGVGQDESINFSGLATGTYFVQVYQYSGDTSYNLSLSAASSNYARTVSGSLRADTFTFQRGYARTVFSGNGNVDFGSGSRDVLDFSSISSNTVSFNLATSTSGGVLYNPGNGTRVFDAITVNNNQILFEGIDRIRFADRTIDLSVTPNDPLFGQQWNLHMMGVHNAWRFTTGSNRVLVGVQDTGLGTDPNGSIHNDLRTTTIYTDNYRDDYSRGGIAKTTSHGTSVQGIIAAASNNGIGMSGINWNSPVFNIDVLDGNAGDQSLAEATQNMINQANSQGQRLVINMSLEGGGINSAFERLIANNQNNALFVIASGNGDTSSVSYPASLASRYNNVIAVGASWGTRDWYGNTTTPGTRISYPGWWGSNYGTGLTLMGPSEVIATDATRSSSGSVNFGFNTRFNGTSAATPNVTGVASLVWSANPNLTATQIRTIMSQTAYDLGASGYDTTYGNGFVNADAAVRRAMAIARGAA
ncbi:S8 family serine peptidase [Microcoleus sp. FACHB-53]|nr:S8 family serine peptidase [Microcoleus sp. FACHB-53]